MGHQVLHGLDYTQFSAETNESQLVPHTEEEVKKKYGALEGERVMKQKKEQGLTEADPNLAGGMLYLLASLKKEWTKGTQETSILSVGEQQIETQDQVGQLLLFFHDKSTQRGSAAKHAIAEEPKGKPQPQTTSGQQGQTGGNPAPEEKPKRVPKRKLEPVTCREKAADLAKKALAKATQASGLATQMGCMQYGHELKAELLEHEKGFKLLGNLNPCL